MELAEAHHGGGDGVPTVRLASNVELHETRLRARLGDVRGHLGPLGFEKVADDDLRALPGEDCRLAPAHTAGAAGDERDLPREPHEGGGSTSRAPEVRSRYSAGISRPASREARRTASTLGPKIVLRSARAHSFDAWTVVREPWKRGMTYRAKSS